MNSQTFQKLREIVYANSGINLSEAKQAMVSSRISKRMRVLSISRAEQYLQYLLNQSGGDEMTHLLNVISTNVTSFFRESDHFTFLEKTVSELISKGKKKIRIWCAASSTGEEPYSIAMTIRELPDAQNVDIRILATDISTRVLAEAHEGRYEEGKTDSIPKSLRSKYFIEEKHNEKKILLASDALKNMISFRRLNLSKTPFPMKGPLDIVFCRNVMIYFDNSVRKKLVSEIFRLLKGGGYLITGHSESLTSITTNFKCVKPSIFLKKH